jgi:hypothetical protein
MRLMTPPLRAAIAAFEDHDHLEHEFRLKLGEMGLEFFVAKLCRTFPAEHPAVAGLLINGSGAFLRLSRFFSVESTPEVSRART